MIEESFSYLTTALGGNLFFGLIAAFGWGVLSIILSPCHLSSIPLVIGYISSQGQIKVQRSLLLAFVFAIGILITIAIIGLITAMMGRLMGDMGQWANYIVALVFIMIGLYLMDIIRWDWSGIQLWKNKRGGMWNALFLGLIFGIGLGPCAFAFLAPVLGVVFQTASDNWPKAMLLLGSFSLGHCAVIVAAGSFTQFVQKYLDWGEKSNSILLLKRICGALVIFAGLYLIFWS